jgi:outer membrane receptor protein involved in Fe transport
VNGSVVPKRAKGDGATYRFNLTWKPAHDVMVYGTISRGFRPGGSTAAPMSIPIARTSSPISNWA